MGADTRFVRIRVRGHDFRWGDQSDPICGMCELKHSEGKDRFCPGFFPYWGKRITKVVVLSLFAAVWASIVVWVIILLPFHLIGLWATGSWVWSEYTWVIWGLIVLLAEMKFWLE